MNKLCIYLSRLYPMSASVGITKNTSDILYTHITHIGHTIIVDELETWNIV
jgi:hypothetical protein